MKEIRIHGRGGQGAVVAARMLTTAFVHEKKWASGFPVFGVERRGAPITAFVRFNEKPIREKTKIYSADCLIVLDSHLFHSVDVFQGIRKDCVLVMNSAEIVDKRYVEELRSVGSVNAMGISVQELGKSITNTCMLGAFARATGWVEVNSVISALGEYFKGKLLEQNIRAVKRGYEETKIRIF